MSAPRTWRRIAGARARKKAVTSRHTPRSDCRHRPFMPQQSPESTCFILSRWMSVVCVVFLLATVLPVRQCRKNTTETQRTTKRTVPSPCWSLVHRHPLVSRLVALSAIGSLRVPLCLRGASTVASASAGEPSGSTARPFRPKWKSISVSSMLQGGFHHHLHQPVEVLGRLRLAGDLTCSLLSP